jgi:hypothetical protein
LDAILHTTVRSFWGRVLRSKGEKFASFLTLVLLFWGQKYISNTYIYEVRSKTNETPLIKRQPQEIARCLFLNFSRHICPGSERTFCCACTTAWRRWQTCLRRWCALPPPTRSWGSPRSGEGQPAVLSLSGTRRSPLVLSQANRGGRGSSWISLAASHFLKIPHHSNGTSW